MWELDLRKRVGVAALVLGMGSSVSQAQQGAAVAFGPDNPFYAPSTLPFHAPPFDRIKDTDYQPAIEAGMAARLAEVEAIANNPAAPTFENTLVALERSGELLRRAEAAFNAVTEANTNPVLEEVEAGGGAEAGGE